MSSDEAVAALASDLRNLAHRLRTVELTVPEFMALASPLRDLLHGLKAYEAEARALAAAHFGHGITVTRPARPSLSLVSNDGPGGEPPRGASAV
ncbi:MAG: hypothetical protein KIT36_07570 [Alphaproteobacteria bacterium]|nr:hypothetical protein [Alphaproteobacteria bacterium]